MQDTGAWPDPHWSVPAGERTEMKYKGILFDLDDTLYDYRTLNEEAISHLCGYASALLDLPGEVFRDAFYRGRERTKAILGENPSARSRLLYMQHTLEYLDKPVIQYAELLERCYWDTILEHMKPFDGAVDVMRRLRRQEVAIGICSDLTTAIQLQKLEKLGLTDMIDVIVTSEEAGCEKPDPAIFRLCLEKLRLAPQTVLMIGDSYRKDVLGAQQAGMDALLYDGDPGNSRGPEDERVTRVRNYKELARYLDRQVAAGPGNEGESGWMRS